ncbi:conserved hypothetical protein [Bosea sp. 62]|uniref:hypothetical protein n=1 Tax=unclassified Bosea (in: a-proteobacteria) TaxID=2653178 RepID=UPI001254EB88|nr:MULTISPECIES: hypothetical protein [unclassified Bosea (in: a-proteobacteria)]CAD5249834.1 conserved hypothetical protein [Bosea sp. 46]CAD5250449.1 conserved hypothetical protein [Bosea sp. 21B]CAD5264281.1 conserved hypothetical protein [Bosea sp. 7B]VVT44150.1 conserved hypothetical protein [Bosea sp. EC-HK365B]VXB12435.1 conserved hypothetical protein [Bosea sp. 29B]
MATKGLTAEQAKLRAERNFAKTEQRRQEAENAMEAVQAERRAIAEKTARLRALRLAKEAADAQIAAEQLAAKPAATKKPAARRTVGKSSAAR